MYFLFFVNFILINIHISKKLLLIMTIVFNNRRHLILHFKQLLESLYQLRGESREGDLLGRDSRIGSGLVGVIKFRTATALSKMKVETREERHKGRKIKGCA